MPKVSEQISKANSTSQGRTDANLANDALHLGGIEANDYATKEYVQEYHNGKESTLKQYIDQKDQAMLNEAKEYTNSQIRNQDFSNFAELEDLQALNTNLSSQITEGLNAQKQYTDQITNQIVSDTNANFKDVEDAIGSLNNNVNSLFQSVSNGKSLIAGAITDKGVPTSASDSYSTMASNIRSIPQTGGSVDPNYVNTSDATATASDIRNGKTAYVKGQKVYGTLMPTSDYPTYGTDTSNATATAEDILEGKTAYARGQLITGTLRNVDIQEIYGVDNNVKINTNPIELEEDYITQQAISIRDISFSEDLNYCVRIEIINNIESLASYPMNDTGLYVMQSTSMGGETETKKYRYSKSDLGISEEESLLRIKLAPGTESTTLLYILTSKYSDDDSNNDYFLYIFTYHLRENGIIGKEYENEKEIVNIKEKINITNGKEFNIYIFPKHTNSNEFFLGYSKESGFGVRYGYLRLYEILINADYTSQTISMKHEYTNLSSNDYSISFVGRELSKNDKFLYRQTYVYNDQRNIIYIDDEITNEIYGVQIGYGRGVEYNHINNRFYTLYQQYADDNYFNIIQHKVVLEGTTLKDYEEKTITINLSNLEPELEKYNLYFNERYIIVYQDYILLFPTNGTGNNQVFCMLINMNINNLTDGSTVQPSTVILNPLSSTFNREYILIHANNNNSRLLIYSRLTYINDIVSLGIDNKNIIAVKYKDKTFYSIDTGVLTALSADVKAGKTFIGQNSLPETGTMEV